MKAEVKSFYSPDVLDLTYYVPDKTDDFCFLMQVFVGPKNQRGEESFDILVCTPKWLLNTVKDEDIIFGHQYLIVPKYDFHAIKQKIESYVNGLTGSSWIELANKISIIGKWEFWNYQSVHGNQIKPKAQAKK